MASNGLGRGGRESAKQWEKLPIVEMCVRRSQYRNTQTQSGSRPTRQMPKTLPKIREAANLVVHATGAGPPLFRLLTNLCACTNQSRCF